MTRTNMTGEPNDEFCDLFKSFEEWSWFRTELYQRDPWNLIQDLVAARYEAALAAGQPFDPAAKVEELFATFDHSQHHSLFCSIQLANVIRALPEYAQLLDRMKANIAKWTDMKCSHIRDEHETKRGRTELPQLAAAWGLEPSHLDELVHDHAAETCCDDCDEYGCECLSERASTVNNHGLAAQIEFLLTEGWPWPVEALEQELRRIAGSPATESAAPAGLEEPAIDQDEVFWAREITLAEITEHLADEDGTVDAATLQLVIDNRDYIGDCIGSLLSRHWTWRDELDDAISALRADAATDPVGVEP